MIDLEAGEGEGEGGGGDGDGDGDGDEDDAMGDQGDAKGEMKVHSTKDSSTEVLKKLRVCSLLPPRTRLTVE